MSYYSRPPDIQLPNYKISNYAPDPEEVSDEILDKLEQAGRVPSKEKFRRMICNTFIFSGACPYNDRCVFLHDYRLKAEGVKAKTTRQTKTSNLIKDTFYWPDMDKREVILNMDSQGLADVNQRYQIPDAFGHASANFHNRALYSLWTHFVAFCMFNRSLKVKEYNNLSLEPFFQESEGRENRYIQDTFRLPIFFQLSNLLQFENHNIDRLEKEFTHAFHTPEDKDDFKSRSSSSLLTDVPRYRTPVDIPSLTYGEHTFVTPKTRRDSFMHSEIDDGGHMMLRTGNLESTRTSSGHEGEFVHADLFSSVQRSLFAATPTKTGTVSEMKTPNIFEESILPAPLAKFEWRIGVPALDLDLIHANRVSATALTCVDTVRSDNTHLMEMPFSEEESGSDPTDEDHIEPEAACSTLDSALESWKTVSLDLAQFALPCDSFSPYIGIDTKGPENTELSSSSVTGDWSNAPFTPRHSGNTNLLGLFEPPSSNPSASVSHSEASTLSAPNTESPPYLDSSNGALNAFSPLQTEESFGCRSAFRRNNPVDKQMSWQPYDTPISSDLSLQIDHFSRGAIDNQSTFGSNMRLSGRDSADFQTSTPLSNLSNEGNYHSFSGHHTSESSFLSARQRASSHSTEAHPTVQAFRGTLTPLDRSLYTVDEGLVSRAGIQKQSYQSHPHQEPQPPMELIIATKNESENAFERDMARLQLKSLQEKKTATAAAHAALSRSGGAFSIPSSRQATRDATRTNSQSWVNNHYLPANPTQQSARQQRVQPATIATFRSASSNNRMPHSESINRSYSLDSNYSQASMNERPQIRQQQKYPQRGYSVRQMAPPAPVNQEYYQQHQGRYEQLSYEQYQQRDEQFSGGTPYHQPSSYYSIEPPQEFTSQQQLGTQQRQQQFYQREQAQQYYGMQQPQHMYPRF